MKLQQLDVIFFPPLCPGRYKFSISAGQGSLLRLPRCHEQLYAVQQRRVPPSDGAVRIPGPNPSFWQEQNKPAGLFWSSQDQRVIRSPPQVSWRGWLLLLGQVASGSARRFGQPANILQPCGSSRAQEGQGKEALGRPRGPSWDHAEVFQGQLVGLRRRRNAKLAARLIYPVTALHLRRPLRKEIKDLGDAEGFGEKTWWLRGKKDTSKVGGATREEASPL